MYSYLTYDKLDYISKHNELYSYTIIEKKSIFTSYIFNISNDAKAKIYINDVKTNNKDARHVVYIYSYLENGILNIISDDDGEPQGTGTKAIYEMLEKEKITNICIVIVRYFGGILLGAGPLSRAYLNSSRKCIENCQKKNLYNYLLTSFKIEYSSYDIIKNRLSTLIEEDVIRVEEENFEDKIELTLKIADFKIDEVKRIIFDK